MCQSMSAAGQALRAHASQVKSVMFCCPYGTEVSLQRVAEWNTRSRNRFHYVAVRLKGEFGTTVATHCPSPLRSRPAIQRKYLERAENLAGPSRIYTGDQFYNEDQLSVNYPIIGILFSEVSQYNIINISFNLTTTELPVIIDDMTFRKRRHKANGWDIER